MRFAGDEWKIREFLYNFYHTLYGDLYKSFSEDVATDLEQMIKALEEIEGLGCVYRLSNFRYKFTFIYFDGKCRTKLYIDCS